MKQRQNVLAAGYQQAAAAAASENKEQWQPLIQKKRAGNTVTERAKLLHRGKCGEHIWEEMYKRGKAKKIGLIC